MSNTRGRLNVMMFLEFFIWGAWLPLIFGYLPSLGFSTGEQSWVLNAFTIGSFTAMFFSAQFADRNFAAEKFLAASQLIGGLSILSLAWVQSFWPFFLLMLVHSLFYVPTISITNSIAFANLQNPSHEFPRVRLWGTIGWIAASWPFVFVLADWAQIPAFGSVPFTEWLGKALGTSKTGAAAQQAALKLAADLETSSLGELVGREYTGDYACSFTTKPGTPEAVLNPTTHLTFSYSTQVVILDDKGQLDRVVAAHDVGRAINPRLCAEQMEGGVHMGLGYALSENFTSTDGRPDSLLLRDLGIVRAKHMPKVDVILIEVPDEVGGYGAKGVGEIGCVSTAGAVAGSLYSYDGVRRFQLPMEDSPAAAPSVPKSRRKSAR